MEEQRGRGEERNSAFSIKTGRDCSNSCPSVGLSFWVLCLACVSFVYLRMRVCGRTLKVKRSTLVVQQEGRAVTSSVERRNATRDPKNRIAFRHRPIAAVQPSAATSRGFFSREHIITHRRRSLVVTIPHLSHAPTQHCGPSAGNSDPPFSAGITPTFLSSELQQ